MNDYKKLEEELETLAEKYGELICLLRKAKELNQKELVERAMKLKDYLEKNICKTLREYAKSHIDSLKDSEIKDMLGINFLSLENYTSRKNNKTFYIA